MNTDLKLSFFEPILAELSLFVPGFQLEMNAYFSQVLNFLWNENMSDSAQSPTMHISQPIQLSLFPFNVFRGRIYRDLLSMIVSS